MLDLKVRDAVVFYDEFRRPHDALLVCIHSQGMSMAEFHETHGSYPCVNLVWVSGDESRTDNNGRQLERQSSVVHKDSMPLAEPAMCWEPKAA